MYAVTQQFLDQMRAPVRQVLAKVAIDYTDPTQDQTIEVTASEQANASYPDQTADFANEPTYKWAALDGTWVLDGTWHLAPLPEDAYLYQMGWWSAQVAGEDGRFSEPYPTLILTHPARPVIAFQVIGDSARGEWPTEFVIRLYGPDGSLLRERSVVGNAETQFYELLDPPALDVTRQELEIRAWSHPGRHAKILEFFTSLQETYQGSDLLEVHLLEESESGNGVGTGGASTNEITVRLVNRGGRFDVTNPQSPFRELLRPNRRVRAWLGVEGAKHLWGEGWYAPFDRDLILSRQNGTVIEPLPNHVVTLRPGEGRVGGAVAVEEGTTNLIANPSFENNLTSWRNWGSPSVREVITSDAYHGSRALRIATTGNNQGVEQVVSLTDGATYTLSCYVKVLSGRAILMTQAGGIYLATETPPEWTGDGKWHRFSLTFTANNTSYIWIGKSSAGAVGEYLFDAVQLEAKPFATSFVDGARANGQLVYEHGPLPEATISFWAKCSPTSTSQVPDWSNLLDWSGKTGRIFVEVYNEEFRRSGGVLGPYDREWHMYTITRTADGTFRFYFDGKYDGSTTSDVVPDTAFIGTSNGRGQWVNALFDELLILPYAASDEFIAELYRETRPLYDEWVPLGTYWSTEWDSQDLEAMVRGRDRLEILRRTSYRPGPLRQNVSLYALAEDVMRSAELPPELYWIDPALQDIVVPWGWVPPGNHREALRVIAEAGMARVYCDRDGILRIERVTTPTWGPVLEITADDYFPPARHPVTSSLVANRVVVTAQPLAPASSPEEVYRATVEVPAGQTITVRAEYNKRPVIDAAASLESPPAGVSIVEGTYGAASADVTIRNTGASAASVTLVIAGRPLSVEGGEQVVEEDDLSIRELGLIVHEVPSNPLIQTSGHARTIAQAILAKSAQQRRDVELEWRGNPALEVNDVVSVNGMQAQVVQQELSWAGALSARLVARRLS